jgi:hypothetical protein
MRVLGSFVVPDSGPSLLRQFGGHFLETVRSPGMFDDLPHHLFIRLTAGHKIAVRADISTIHFPGHQSSSIQNKSGQV